MRPARTLSTLYALCVLWWVPSPASAQSTDPPTSVEQPQPDATQETVDPAQPPTAEEPGDPLMEGAVEPDSLPETVPDAVEESSPYGVAEGGDIYVRSVKPRNPGRATTMVTRDDLEIRLPRSAPDTLRYEPGVYVQQTAHSQGSAFIRGRTGQQTVLLFDEVRLNNSLFRQGPNQYFFTIDSHTIQSVEVVRGSASTRYGTDAIAGVIEARPLEPTLQKPGEVHLSPRLIARHNTADKEVGGRLQLDAAWGDLGFIGGVGGRTVGMLQSGGPIFNPQDGELPKVPRFDTDGRTQLGTGFDELTNDARVVYKASDSLTLTAAWYDYRQFDAPRTDQCPPAYAPHDECLKYDEQFREVAYLSADVHLGQAAETGRLLLSYQHQHERRTSERPSSYIINGGRDDVDTVGALARATTAPIELAEPATLRVSYGADVYHDTVASTAWLIFDDLDITRLRSRGQYIDGATYGWGGAWSEAEVQLYDAVVVRAGGRYAAVTASADGDAASGTLPIDQLWTAWVGNAAVEWWTTPWLTLEVGADQGFRAPNLDDLTSRQQTGPGFQFENADLNPERALTLELGGHIVTPAFELDAWLYGSNLTSSIARAPRNDVDCPPETRQCQNSWNRYQLVNLDGQAVIWGAEGTARLKLPYGLSLRSTLSYAWGDGPNPQDRPADPTLRYQERVALSRIPPLNGTVELIWRRRGVWAGAGLRWATLQDRLALADVSDERIPLGGTPGYAVIDVRTGYRIQPWTLLSLVLENVTDEAYRNHGSSVNGPGRGLNVQLEVGF